MGLAVLSESNMEYASAMVIPRLPLNLSNWQHYFNIDNEGDTPLMMSIILGDERGAVFIIDVAKGNNCIDLLDVQNRTYRQSALHLAVICNMTSVAKALILAGVDLTLKDRNGNTALHTACQNCTRYHNHWSGCICRDTLQVISYKYGISTCKELAGLYNYSGNDCLHLAVASNNVCAIDYLLVCLCIDVNSQERMNGKTVLHKVVHEKNIFLLVYLLQCAKGWDINAKTWDGHTPIKLAILNKSYFITKLLFLHFIKKVL